MLGKNSQERLRYVGVDESYTKILENGTVLHRIVALRDFEIRGVKISKGQLGGWYNGNDWVHTYSSFWIDYSSMVCTMCARLIIANSYISKNVVITGNGFSEIINSFIRDGVRIFTHHSSYIDNSILNGKMTIINPHIRYSTILGCSPLYGMVNIDSCKIVSSTLQPNRRYTLKLKDSALGLVELKHSHNNTSITKGQCITNQTISGDYDNNFTKSLYAQTGLVPINGKVYAYKTVLKSLRSLYDTDFVYEVGKVAVAENVDPDPTHSCSAGLHFSTANYFTEYDPFIYSTLYAEIDVKDIIAVCDGKIRCSKAKILAVCDDEF